MMKKHRSSKHSHKFKIQIKPRPRTRSVMATDRQKHIKRMKELKERVLPGQMKPRQCSPNPEIDCNSKEGFCKNSSRRKNEAMADSKKNELSERERARRRNEKVKKR